MILYSFLRNLAEKVWREFDWEIVAIWRDGFVDSYNLDPLIVHSASHCEKIAVAPGNFGE